MTQGTILVTGTSRSGTTLLEKMLSSHPDIYLVSQPMPYMYRMIKEKFYASIGYTNKQYVLNDLFDPEYSRKDFIDFVNNYKIPRKDFDNILHLMQDWSGQYERLININEVISNYESDKLVSVYEYILSQYITKSKYEYIGSKETLIEEFVPYFLSKGIKVIMIIRDPRDVYTSINIGKGTEYTGKRRPALFHLRNWRKSVAIINTFKNWNKFTFVKYEDILKYKEKELNKLTDFLSVDDFSKGYFDKGIRTKDGALWKGNSSNKKHQGINEKNIGKYKNHFNNNTIGYIEFICGPEMKSMGYNKNIDKYNPYNFVEPYSLDNTGLNNNMSVSKIELSKEDKRLEYLRNNSISHEIIEKYFYSKENYMELKESMLC